MTTHGYWRRAGWHILGWLIFALILLIAPRFLDRVGIFTLTEILILAICATSLNLLIGYTRMISFGHAAYFGVGAYVVGIGLQKVGWLNVPLALLLGIVSTTVVALVIGFFCVRRDEVYFSMLTLAFAQVIQLAIIRMDKLTGGSEGLTGGIPRPPIDLSFIQIDLNGPVPFYYASAVAAVLCLAAIRLIVSSPFGVSLRAIAANPDRAQASGVNVRLHQLAAFVLAAAFAGIAGGFYGMFQLAAYPEMLDWTMSAQFLNMVLIGGIGYFFGPAIGAAVVVMLRFVLPQVTQETELVLGVLLVAVVLGLRGGVAAALIAGWRGIWSRGQHAEPATSELADGRAT